MSGKARARRADLVDLEHAAVTFPQRGRGPRLCEAKTPGLCPSSLRVIPESLERDRTQRPEAVEGGAKLRVEKGEEGAGEPAVSWWLQAVQLPWSWAAFPSRSQVPGCKASICLPMPALVHLRPPSPETPPVLLLLLAAGLL